MKKVALFSMIISIIMIFGTVEDVFSQEMPNLTGYFVAVDGQLTGPHDMAGLTELVNRGRLNRDTLVWREGMPAWATAETVEELAPLFPTIPPISPTAQRERVWYNSFSPSIENNRVFINAGVGLGPTSGYVMSIPPISASVNFRISDTIPITVGVTGIITQWRWDIWIYYVNIGVGARLMYHFNFARNLDFYAGLSLGYVYQHIISHGILTPTVVSNNSFLLWSAFIGTRFFFTNHFGVYAEAGVGNLQFISVGLALKF